MSDQTSTSSDDMTAEDQNLRNSETDDIHNILGRFMEAKEETLEELVGGLMFLTMEDVRNSISSVLADASNQNGLCVTTSVKRDLDNDDGATETSSFGLALTDQHNNTSIDKKRDTGMASQESEDIEEEVLDEEVCATQTCGDVVLRHRPSVTKFDNFVDSAGDSCSDTEDKAGKDGQEGEEEEDDWLPSSGYMASFDTGKVTEQEAPSDSISKSLAETGSLEKSNASSWSSDKRLQALGTGDVITGHSRDNSVLDSCLTNSECDEFSEDCDADVEVPSSGLNPGEAEEELRELPVVPNISVMEFKSSVVSHTDTEKCDDNSGGAEESCTDEVVPFELDEDFDYDSVAYTPKFTQAEISYLASFLPNNS